MAEGGGRELVVPCDAGSPVMALLLSRVGAGRRNLDRFPLLTLAPSLDWPLSSGVSINIHLNLKTSSRILEIAIRPAGWSRDPGSAAPGRASGQGYGDPEQVDQDPGVPPESLGFCRDALHQLLRAVAALPGLPRRRSSRVTVNLGAPSPCPAQCRKTPGARSSAHNNVMTTPARHRPPDGPIYRTPMWWETQRLSGSAVPMRHHRSTAAQNASPPRPPQAGCARRASSSRS